MIGVTMADVLTKAIRKHRLVRFEIEGEGYGTTDRSPEELAELCASALAAAGFGHIWTALDDKAEQEDP